MSALGPEAKAILRQGAAGDSPHEDDRARVRRRLAAALGAASVAGAAGTAKAASTAELAGAAQAAGVGKLGLLGKVALTAVVVSGVALGVRQMTGPATAPAPMAPTGADRQGVAQAGQGAGLQARPQTAPQEDLTPAATASPSGVKPAAAAPTVAVPAAATVSMKTRSRRAATNANRPGAPAPPTQHAPAQVLHSLGAELELLSRAQAALSEGKPSAALSHLAAHGRRFPHGSLAEERTAAQAIAHCQLGHTGKGRRLLRRLQAASPNHPLFARVRTACRGAQSGATPGPGGNPEDEVD